MKVNFQDQITIKDKKIGGLEERFEGVEDQLTLKDQQINQLMTNTVNDMKAQIQVKIRIISKVINVKSKPICLLQDFQYSDEEPTRPERPTNQPIDQLG